jgi:hypothetical protein
MNSRKKSKQNGFHVTFPLFFLLLLEFFPTENKNSINFPPNEEDVLFIDFS